MTLVHRIKLRGVKFYIIFVRIEYILFLKNCNVNTIDDKIVTIIRLSRTTAVRITVVGYDVRSSKSRDSKSKNELNVALKCSHEFVHC